MAMSVGGSRGFSAPVSTPVTPPPAPAPQASNTAAVEGLLQQGHRGTVVNTKA